MTRDLMGRCRAALCFCLPCVLFMTNGLAAPEEATIPVLAWIGPPANETTAERYHELAGAGFSHSFSSFPDSKAMTAALDIAQAAGVKLFVSVPELSSDPEGAVRKFRAHPALAGYYLRDEPSAADFPSLAKWVKQIQAVDKEHGCYINLFPNYANAQQLRCATYQEHVDRFVAEVPVPFLSFDHYPVIGDRLRPEWYQNLEIIAKAARDAKKPFWAFALAVAHGPYPVPTLAHLRLQVFSDLAYGAQAIQYFTYWTVKDTTWNFHDAPISVTGERTVVYERVKQVNQEIRNLSRVFRGAEVLSVGHTGEALPAGTKRFEARAPVSKLETEGQGAVVSLLANRDKRFLVIVNRDFQRTMPFGAAFDDAIRIERVGKDGKVNSIKETRFKSVIEPGGIAIFGWATSNIEPASRP